MKLSKEPKLTVRVLSPTEIHYDGPAVAVSAQNKVGPFDILADHANFFSVITAGAIIVHTGTSDIPFAVSKGIVKVHDNKVTFFIDIEPAYLASK